MVRLPLEVEPDADRRVLQHYKKTKHDKRRKSEPVSQEGRAGTGFRFCVRGPCSRFQPGRPLLSGQETARNMDRCDRI